MELNITALMNSEEILEIVNKAIVVPSLSLFFGIYLILSLVIGLIAFDTSKGRLKYFTVWIIVTLVMGGILVFLIYNPEFIQSIMEFLSNE